MYNINENNIMNTHKNSIVHINENDAMTAHINDFNIWLEESIKRREHHESLENNNSCSKVYNNNFIQTFNPFDNIYIEKDTEQINNSVLKKLINIDIDNITEKDLQYNDIILLDNNKIIDGYKRQLHINNQKIYINNQKIFNNHQTIQCNNQKFLNNHQAIQCNNQKFLNNHQAIQCNNQKFLNNQVNKDIINKSNDHNTPIHIYISNYQSYINNYFDFYNKYIILNI
jgi:hypothetical protein